MQKSYFKEKLTITNAWLKKKAKPDWANTLQGAIGFLIVFILTWEYRGLVEANEMLLPLIGGLLGVPISYVLIWIFYYLFISPREVWKEKTELEKKVKLREFGEGFYKMLTQHIEEGRLFVNNINDENVAQYKLKHSDWCVRMCNIFVELKLDHTWKDRFLNQNDDMMQLIAKNADGMKFGGHKSEKQHLLVEIRRHILNLDYMRNETRKHILKTYKQ